MSSWQSSTVEANGIRLHYTRTGGAKPPFLLAHGFSDDGLCWTPVAEALAPDFDVVMVDARGHGRSEAPEQGYGPAEHAADLAGMIAALGLQRPVILGHSMGAATTLVLAGMYPNVPGRILLEDPPARWMETPENTTAQTDRWAGMRAWITGLQGKTREELIAEQRAQTPHWPDAELGPWADSKLRFRLEAISTLGRSGVAPVDWPATLRRVTCPALLITADPDRGAIVTEKAAESLQTLLPHVRIAHIADAGHSIHRDQPDRFLEVVRTFLRDNAG